jgi:hypothetical protein
MGACAKLAPRHCRAFEIFYRVGLVAYRLALPPKVKALIPLFPPTCKYNYNLLKDYGQTDYVWMLELMNLLL